MEIRGILIDSHIDAFYTGVAQFINGCRGVFEQPLLVLGIGPRLGNGLGAVHWANILLELIDNLVDGVSRC